jgi:hypothetical protein
MFSVMVEQRIKGREEPPRVECDILDGTCTCGRLENSDPCAHLFAAMIWAQMSALDRAWRETHEDVCLRRWCSRPRALKHGLCWNHHYEFRRHFEWQELRDLRKCRDVLAMRALLQQKRRDDPEGDKGED